MLSNKLSNVIEFGVVAVLTSVPILLLAIFFYGLVTILWPTPSCGAEYLGNMSANEFAADSCSNPFSSCGNPFSANSPNNPFGPYGNPYSPYSVNNPYATDAPSLYGHADE